MSQGTHIHHMIDYIEFAVTDIAKAKEFYSKAFGWKFNDHGPSYCGIQKENGEIGGMRLETTVARGGPLVILYSTDLQDSLKKVMAANGFITQEIFTFPGGKRFHFKDPSGNELGVWSEK